MVVKPNWFQQLRQEWTIPEVIPERCVHSRCEVSTCTRCVDSCPRNAWILDDDSLKIDTQACDGCGLCVGVCPESALEVDLRPALRKLENHQTLLFACEAIAGGQSDVGIVPCLHSINMAKLLGYWNDGYVQMLSCRAHCQTCPRYPQQDVFREQVARLNTLLASRGKTTLRHAELTIENWSNYRKTLALVQPESVEPVARRDFLRKAITLASESTLEQLEAAQATQATLEPWPIRLPEAEQGRDLDPVFPYLPSIDAIRCNGCNACVRLCPHEALQLEQDAESKVAIAYRMLAERCTGCHLCEDACDREAVSVKVMQPQNQSVLALKVNKCKACGTAFHYPIGQSEQVYCRICAHTNHHSKLFQVYS